MSWLACQWSLLHNSFVPKFLAPSLLFFPFSESSIPSSTVFNHLLFKLPLQTLTTTGEDYVQVFYESLAATMAIVDDPSPLSHLTFLRLGVHASGAQLVEIACTLRAREALPLSTIFYLISP